MQQNYLRWSILRIMIGTGNKCLWVAHSHSLASWWLKSLSIFFLLPFKINSTDFFEFLFLVRSWDNRCLCLFVYFTPNFHQSLFPSLRSACCWFTVLFCLYNVFSCNVGSSWLKNKRTNTKPCVLVTSGKLSGCVDRLLQFLLFGPSAVAKRSLLHEAGEELVDVCASFQEAFRRLLRLLFCLVGCDF